MTFALYGATSKAAGDSPARLLFSLRDLQSRRHDGRATAPVKRSQRQGGRGGVNLLRSRDIPTAAEKLLEVNGRFAMAHRPLRWRKPSPARHAHHLEPERMRLVYPLRIASRRWFLLRRCAADVPVWKSGPPLAILRKDSRYTDELLEIYGIKPLKLTERNPEISGITEGRRV